MAENLPIKHSLSEAIHNSSISKIDIQSQHPTYPLEDIDQERLLKTRSVPNQTGPRPDRSQITQVQTRPVPDHTKACPDSYGSADRDNISSTCIKLDCSKPMTDRWCVIFYYS